MYGDDPSGGATALGVSAHAQAEFDDPIEMEDDVRGEGWCWLMGWVAMTTGSLKRLHPCSLIKYKH